MLPPLTQLSLDALAIGVASKRPMPDAGEDHASDVPALPQELQEKILRELLDDLFRSDMKDAKVGRLCKRLVRACRIFRNDTCEDPNNDIWTSAVRFFGLAKLEPQDAPYPQPPLHMTYKSLIFELCDAFANDGITLKFDGVTYSLWEAVKLCLQKYLQAKNHSDNGWQSIESVGVDTFRSDVRAPKLEAIKRKRAAKLVGWYRGGGWYYPLKYKAEWKDFQDFRSDNGNPPPSDPRVLEEYTSYTQECAMLDRQLFLDLAVAMWEWHRNGGQRADGTYVGISDPGVSRPWTVLMWLFAARSGLEFPLDAQGHMMQPPDGWYGVH